MREKDLARSRSVDYPWEAACIMSKGWHCWISWHSCNILEVTNLARGLEVTVRTITKVGTNSIMSQIKKEWLLEEGVQGMSQLSKALLPLYLTQAEEKYSRTSPL